MMSVGNLVQNKIRPHYSFQIERHNFIIKIADSEDEIQQALKLRSKVFSQVALNFNNDIDIDDYDHNADHLIVIDKSSKTVVGTYRFLLSDKVTKHYSSREFDISEFLKLPGRKLELGRASVDPSARAGVIITLLWRGIAEYLKLTQADYLFGCSSMWEVNSDNIALLISAFKDKSLVTNISITPLESHKPKDLKPVDYVKPHNEDEIKKANIAYQDLVPTLVKTYIHVGALFSIPPAYDPKLGTYEFFGFVKTENINSAFKKKYLD